MTKHAAVQMRALWRPIGLGPFEVGATYPMFVDGTPVGELTILDYKLGAGPGPHGVVWWADVLTMFHNDEPEEIDGMPEAELLMHPPTPIAAKPDKPGELWGKPIVMVGDTEINATDVVGCGSLLGIGLAWAYGLVWAAIHAVRWILR